MIIGLPPTPLEMFKLNIQTGISTLHEHSLIWSSLICITPTHPVLPITDSVEFYSSVAFFNVLSLSTVVLNSRDRQGMYGMQHFRAPINKPHNSL